MYARRHVVQYDKSGDLIREWPSIYAAVCTICQPCDNIRTKYASVCHCLRGRQKTALNYVWRYKNRTKRV